MSWVSIASLAIMMVQAAPSRDELPWPPSGPTWETDPAQAMARAQKEHKPILAYVATEGCPSCVRLAHDFWPKPEVVEATKRIVCLAIYRYKVEQERYLPTEWAIRLNVMAYPQAFFLDASGSPLPECRVLTSASAIRRSVESACEKIAKLGNTVRRSVLPAALQKATAADMRSRLESSDCITRSAAWREVLDSSDPDPEDLLTLFGWETDAVVRLAVLEEIENRAPDKAMLRLVKQAVEDENDYVRDKAISLLAKLPRQEAASILANMIRRIERRESGYGNPNNMLCSAAAACATVRDPSLIEPLRSILEKEDANNNATLLAVEALIAIGHQYRMTMVAEALSKAQHLQGAHATRISILIEDALREQ
jgi:hypothetical protein